LFAPFGLSFACRASPLSFRIPRVGASLARKIVFGRELFLLAALFHKILLRKILRTIDHGTVRPDTRYMARYSAFLGRAVEVQYRAGDICLPASGTFVADSGRSIFLEQHYEQCGQQKNFRWEIPYQCIVRLAGAEPIAPSDPSMDAAEVLDLASDADRPLQANAARASAGASLLPLGRRPETA
jgi:hypothetical protein